QPPENADVLTSLERIWPRQFVQIPVFSLFAGRGASETGSPMTTSTTRGSRANRAILVVVKFLDLSVV
ncbi:hypothetical protein, partial [Methylobacterium sp. J-076]|uniref:hypothetical protein n=1 Tax=Methylobacterium sp. J-076 TaxID=2836655 RepID=UPI001FB9792F